MGLDFREHEEWNWGTNKYLRLRLSDVCNGCDYAKIITTTLARRQRVKEAT